MNPRRRPHPVVGMAGEVGAEGDGDLDGLPEAHGHGLPSHPWGVEPGRGVGPSLTASRWAEPSAFRKAPAMWSASRHPSPAHSLCHMNHTPAVKAGAFMRENRGARFDGEEGWFHRPGGHGHHPARR